MSTKSNVQDATALHACCNEIPAACSRYRSYRSALFARYLEFRPVRAGLQIRYRLGMRPCPAAAFLRPRVAVSKGLHIDGLPPEIVITHSSATCNPDAAFGSPQDFAVWRGEDEVTDYSPPHVAAMKVNDAIARTAEAAERLTALVGQLLVGIRSLDLPVDTSPLAVFFDRVPWTPFFYAEENRTFSGPASTETAASLQAILDEEAPRLQAVLETAHRATRALPPPTKRRRNGSSRGRGRPTAADRDPAFDRRVYEAMQGGGTTYDELARSWGHSVDRLKLARDRHRKALEKMTAKRDVK